eukprot:163259-Pyramimonas_sp.AAC.1
MSVGEDSALVVADAAEGKVLRRVDCDGGFTGVALATVGSDPLGSSDAVRALVGGWGSNNLTLWTLRMDRLGGTDGIVKAKLDCTGMGRTADVSITPDGRRGVAVSSNEPSEPQVTRRFGSDQSEPRIMK